MPANECADEIVTQAGEEPTTGGPSAAPSRPPASSRRVPRGQARPSLARPATNSHPLLPRTMRPTFVRLLTSHLGRNPLAPLAHTLLYPPPCPLAVPKGCPCLRAGLHSPHYQLVPSARLDASLRTSLMLKDTCRLAPALCPPEPVSQDGRQRCESRA